MSFTEISQQAINQALAGNWQAAVDLNQEIIKQNPQDIEALSRLAKAYTELGKKTLALKTYRKVLQLDQFNPIAKNNLAKFSAKKSEQRE
jgi:Flp pilus assembly protein TadD